MQMTMEAQAAYVPVASVPVPDVSSADVPMDIDHPPRGQKRGAEESPAPEGHKKAKTGKHQHSDPLLTLDLTRRAEQKPPPLKRFASNHNYLRNNMAEIP